MNATQNGTVFARAMREEMDKHNVNQADIAYALKISAQYVSDVMRNRRYPFDITQIYQLYQTFGFDLKKLSLARAWTVKQINIPHFATWEQVEEAIEILNRHKEKERSYA